MRSLAPALALALAVPFPPSNAATPPKPEELAVTAAEVAVDFVVRGKKGRIVRDLKPREVEVYEDGVRQEVAIFSLMATAPADLGPPVVLTPGATATPPPPPVSGAPDIEREAVVALVFDRLGPQARVSAHDAALAWVKLPAVAGRQVGVFRIDQGLEQLQGFTDDRATVQEALDDMLRSLPTAYGGRLERERLRTLRAKLTALEGRGSPQSVIGNVSAEEAGAALITEESEVRHSAVARDVARRMAMTEIAMLQAGEALERDQQGLATTNGLLALVNGLRTLPGRKAVVFFSEGLVLPPRVQDTLASVVSEANRGGVSFYAADAAGLRARSSSDEMRREVAAMTDELDAARMDPAGRGSTAAMSRMLERNEDVLRFDPASGLSTLARETGGFLIRDTNDIAAGLKRVEEELGAYYLLSYAPRNEAWDGRYRRIEVRVRRGGLSVQARRGYFAVKTPMPTPVLDYEAPALARLEREPKADTLPVRGQALHFPVEDGESLVALVAQLPAGAPSLVRDKDASGFSQDFTVLALVRDGTGRVVAKASRRYALSWPASKVEDVRKGRVLFTREARLAPGRYAVEMMVYDAQNDGAGVQRFPLEVPRGTGLRVSSLMVVGHAEPRALAEPGALLYRGYELYPSFGEPVRASSGKPLAFLVSLRSEQRPVVEATLEAVRDGKTVLRTPVGLPEPDEGGAIRLVGELPNASLGPGQYELRLRVSDGTSAQTRSTELTIAP